MHQVKLAKMLQMFTQCCSWRLSRPNSCLELISHCSSKKKPWMWWGKIFHGLLDNILPHHEIFCDVAKYYAMSHNNIHMVEEYIKNIPWHGMEYALRFLFCSPEHFQLFACLPTSIIVIWRCANLKVHRSWTWCVMF
jgi:hypothetical protein